MADNIQIGAKITVDSGQAEQGLKNVGNALNNTKGAAREAAGETKGTSSAFGSLKEKLNALPGAAGGAAQGVGQLTSAFRAIIATPLGLMITAIVGGLAFLYKSFTNTFEGANKVKQIFAGLSASVEVVLDRVFALGRSILKFLSGDFKGAVQDGKAALTGVGQEVVDTFEKVKKLTDESQKLHKEQLANDLDAVKRQKELAKLKEQAYDENVTSAQRLAALNQLKAAQEKNAKEDIDLAKRVSDNRIALLSVGKDAELKNADEINKIRIEQQQVETENANEGRLIEKQITAAKKQQIQERKEAEQKAAEARKAQIQNLTEYQNKMLKLQQEDELMMLDEGLEKEKKVIQNRRAEEKRENDLAFREKKISKEQQNNLDLKQQEVANRQMAALDKKYEKDKKANEKKFEDDLAALKEENMLASITDLREKELKALDITYQKKREQLLADTILSEKQKNLMLAEFAKQNEMQKNGINNKFDKEDKSKALKDLITNLDTDYKLRSQNNKLKLKDELDLFDKKRAAMRQDLIDKKASEAEIRQFDVDTAQLRDEIRQRDKDAQLAHYDTIGNALGALGQLAGEQTVIGKSLSVAQAIINTYTGATKAYGQGGIFGIAAAAAIVANGLGMVRKIMAVDTSGKKSSSGSLSAPSPITPAAPLSPQLATTKLNQSDINSIGNAAGQRVFVLESDVANNAERIKRLNRAARLN